MLSAWDSIKQEKVRTSKKMHSTPHSKISKVWKSAPKGCEVCECYKCAGSGVFHFQDGRKGICYACNGAKVVPSKLAKTADLEKGKRHITKVNYEDDKLIVYYLAYNKEGALEAWIRHWGNVSSLKEETKEQLRTLYRISKER